jgi:uncharacterized membrane protein
MKDVTMNLNTLVNLVWKNPFTSANAAAIVTVNVLHAVGVQLPVDVNTLTTVFTVLGLFSAKDGTTHSTMAEVQKAGK